MRKRAEELFASPQAVEAIEQLLRGQVYISEAGLRAEIQGLGFGVSAVGESWAIFYPGDRDRHRCVFGPEETAASACRALAAKLREKADALEALVK